MCTVPRHQELKIELIQSFDKSKSYVGSHIRGVIEQADFKSCQDSPNKPDKIKKGDAILVFQDGVKRRPGIVIKVLKDRTVVYTTLTSQSNVHSLTPYTSRFFGEGYFSKSLSVCTEEFVLENFTGVFDNDKALNKAIKALKEYINTNL